VPVPRGEVRPTSERARQAYFNIIAGRIDGTRFLDLFAGSGIFSFEALSRGAREAVAVDSSRQNLRAIGELAAAFGVDVTTVPGDAVKALFGLRGPFGLVYADPPYDFGRHDELLQALDALPLAPGAIVAVEHRRHTSPFTVEPRRLQFWRRAEYGEVWITFFAAPEASGLQ
jgi:16S rRNA (guanine(966)-N(2))-methyltransferase RsmD